VDINIPFKLSSSSSSSSLALCSEKHVMHQ